MIYKKPAKTGCLISVIMATIFAIICGFILGIFAGPAGFIIGPIMGFLVAIHQNGKDAEEKEKKYEEAQKFVMQKVQTGVPLSAEEQNLWNTMNKQSSVPK